MLDHLAVTGYILVLILAANLEATRRINFPLLAVLTLGLAHSSSLWRLIATAVKRLCFGEGLAFDARKPVHRTAALLLLLGSGLFVSLSLTGAVNDRGAMPAATPHEAINQLLSAGALNLALAFLGVGWLSRRSSAEALRRLGLRRPSLRETVISVLAAVALWKLAAAATTLWAQMVPAEVFEQQNAAGRQVFRAFEGSMASALLLAIVAATSEEILYRGALQPIFGLFISSLFFTLMHLQYGLSPAALILFGVTLGFAWLRLRYCASAAIIAHAVYNFLPYSLAIQ